MRTGLLVAAALIIALADACGGQAYADGTWGKQASAGGSVFSGTCASCHGGHGQGNTAPAIIGPNEQLSKYQTAQGLLNFVSAAMPFYNPGTLSQQQYSDVVVYLLVQNQFVNPNSTSDPGQFGNITLK